MGEASPRATRWILGILPAAAVLALVYIAWRGPDAGPASAPTPLAAPEVATVEPTTVEPAAVPDPVAAPSGEAAAPRTPAFDVVRVEPDGQAAVVGTAEPGAKVTIFAEAQPLAETEADASGNFVALFKVEPSAEPRALTLGSTAPNGVAASSPEVVMLLPQAPAVPEPAPGAAPGAPVPPGPGQGAAPAAALPAPQVDTAGEAAPP